MSVALLDVNLLIALAWPLHIHHSAAHRWFAKNFRRGWATCPITQCAFIRISSNPRIIAEAVSPGEAAAMLQRIVLQDHHIFWPDSIPFFDSSIPNSLLMGHQQVVDAYLLGLAIRNNGKLVTFDKGVSTLVSSKAKNRSSVEVVPVD